ncbi:MAG: transcription antitermination factor NusB [Proteobacteria bacterium]|nr:transcription antitermination factor NusB [Pseudomonadota bacterium]
MTASKPVTGARSAARLAAVQALYQMWVTGVSPEAVIGEFIEHRFGREFDGLIYEGADRAFFEDIVRGVAARETEIAAVVHEALSKDRELGRLEKILAAALRAGAYELLARVDVPARAIISEYVDVAHAFFEGPQPGFVNGVLDQIAKQIRADEMAAKRSQKGAA